MLFRSLLLQGTETLSLRVERHVQNALKVVEYLQTVPEVESVSHPSIPGRPDHDLYEKYFPNGAGSIFTFDIKGGKDAARVFIDNLHQMAGSRKVLELHGSVYRNHCTKCGAFYDFSYVKQSSGMPRCETCGRSEERRVGKEC